MEPMHISPLPTGTYQLTIPGSKSYTNRALVLAALAPQPVRLEQPLLSDDTEAMIGCLRALGIEIRQESDALTVVGDVSQIADQAYTLDANLSGTTIRFLLAMACVMPGVQILTGGEGLLKRPIGDLVDGLRQLGADITYLGLEDFPPLRVNSTQLHGGTIQLDGSISSQYLSAILMIAPMISEHLRIDVTGKQISKPYVDMTIDTMAAFGVDMAEPRPQAYDINPGQQYKCDTYVVEGDYSSAAYFFAMAALTSSTITVHNLKPHSVQADRKFLHVLQQMGNQVLYNDTSITVVGSGVKAMDFDMTDCPDQAMTAAVLAAFAPGTTILNGVQSLRVKETERVAALEAELAKMGIQTTSTHSTLTIHGGNPRPATIDTYGDHRMAMAFTVAGRKLPGMVINNPEVVSKTFPGFWDELNALTTTTNVVLIGMRGTGKTTVGKLLAEQLGKQYIDMDTLLEERVGMTLSDFVKQNGWDRFREEESTLTSSLHATTGAIISTGGGVIIRDQNIAILQRLGTIIWLEATPHTIVARIKDATDRAPLTAAKTLLEEITQVLHERKPRYETTAEHRVMTEAKTPQEIAAEITQLLGADAITKSDKL